MAACAARLRHSQAHCSSPSRSCTRWTAPSAAPTATHTCESRTCWTDASGKAPCTQTVPTVNLAAGGHVLTGHCCCALPRQWAFCMHVHHAPAGSTGMFCLPVVPCCPIARTGTGFSTTSASCCLTPSSRSARKKKSWQSWHMVSDGYSRRALACALDRLAAHMHRAEVHRRLCVAQPCACGLW